MRCRPASAPGLNANKSWPLCGTFINVPVSNSVDGSGTGGGVNTGSGLGAGVVAETETLSAGGVGDGLTIGRGLFSSGTVTAVDIEPPSSSSIAAGFPTAKPLDRRDAFRSQHEHAAGINQKGAALLGQRDSTLRTIE